MQVTTVFFFLFFYTFPSKLRRLSNEAFFRDFLLHLNQRPLASERRLNNQLNNKTSYSHGCTGYVKRRHVPDYCFYCTVFLPANSAVSFRSSPFGRQVVNLIPPPPPPPPPSPAVFFLLTSLCAVPAVWAAGTGTGKVPYFEQYLFWLVFLNHSFILFVLTCYPKNHETLADFYFKELTQRKSLAKSFNAFFHISQQASAGSKVPKSDKFFLLLSL